MRFMTLKVFMLCGNVVTDPSSLVIIISSGCLYSIDILVVVYILLIF